jgi:uncharacterized protein YeaO (DUF488 family)
MARIRTFRYERGTRNRWEGLRFLTMRRWPMYVTQAESRRYFDAWLQTLAPTNALRKAYSSGRISRAVFVRRYRAEMRKPEARQAIRALADLSRKVPIQVGCGCDSEDVCHRPVLRDLIANEARRLAL